MFSPGCVCRANGPYFCPHSKLPRRRTAGKDEQVYEQTTPALYFLWHTSRGRQGAELFPPGQCPGPVFCGGRPSQQPHRRANHLSPRNGNDLHNSRRSQGMADRPGNQSARNLAFFDVCRQPLTVVAKIDTDQRPQVAGAKETGFEVDPKELERRQQEAEEQRLAEARAHGTPVTVDTFLAWKREFDAEKQQLRGQREPEIANKDKGPTGRAFFLAQDASGDQVGLPWFAARRQGPAKRACQAVCLQARFLDRPCGCRVSKRRALRRATTTSMRMKVGRATHHR